MAVYASESDLDAYGAQVGKLDAEELLRRAETDIDSIIGPLPVGENGRKYDPEDLDETGAAALSRATCAQAAFRVSQGEDAMLGTDDYLPSEFTPLRRGGRVSPQALTELAGQGLIIASGTVSTTSA